jgi:hypothetical protein
MSRPKLIISLMITNSNVDQALTKKIFWETNMKMTSPQMIKATTNNSKTPMMNLNVKTMELTCSISFRVPSNWMKENSNKSKLNRISSLTLKMMMRDLTIWNVLTILMRTSNQYRMMLSMMSFQPLLVRTLRTSKSKMIQGSSTMTSLTSQRVSVRGSRTSSS